jgi:hypothetical protein
VTVHQGTEMSIHKPDETIKREKSTTRINWLFAGPYRRRVILLLMAILLLPLCSELSVPLANLLFVSDEYFVGS